MDTIGFTFLNHTACINGILEDSTGKENVKPKKLKDATIFLNYIAVRMSANSKRLLKTICQDAAQDLFRIPLGII